MPQFIALWTKPQQDLEGFEEHYRTTHSEIVRRWPGFLRADVIRTPRSPLADEPEFHLVTVVHVEDLKAALRSDAGAEAVEDATALMERHGNRMVTLIGDEL